MFHEKKGEDNNIIRNWFQANNVWEYFLKTKPSYIVSSHLVLATTIFACKSSVSRHYT